MKSVTLKWALAGLTALLCANLSFAGNENSGGGFYGKVKINGVYKWALLDELEEGTLFDPTPYAEEILGKVDATLPGLATDLRKFISKKTWHLVPYELQCEAPNSPIQVEQSAGACQDDHDVWIHEARFNAGSKSKLIIHELLQGQRLEINKRISDPTEKRPPSSVRALTRALTRTPFPTATALQDEVAKYGFYVYDTFDVVQKQLEKKRALEAEVKTRIDTALSKACKIISESEQNPSNPYNVWIAYFAIADAMVDGSSAAHYGADYADYYTRGHYQDMVRNYKSKMDELTRFRHSFATQPKQEKTKILEDKIFSKTWCQ